MPRVSVREAGEILGITREAVRKRISRGTLPAEKVDGEWIIDLPDQAGSPEDASGDSRGWMERDALVEQLRSENEHLRQSLEAAKAESREEKEWLRGALSVRDEEIRRRDHIIAGFQRQLPANTETRPGLWQRIGRWVKGE